MTRPARLRRLGWTDVPLLGAAEVRFPTGSARRCIRVLLYFDTTKPQRALKDMYSGGPRGSGRIDDGQMGRWADGRNGRNSLSAHQPIRRCQSYRPRRRALEARPSLDLTAVTSPNEPGKILVSCRHRSQGSSRTRRSTHRAPRSGCGCSRVADEPIDAHLVDEGIWVTPPSAAWASVPATWRAAHAEGDGFPSLSSSSNGPSIVAQLRSAGLETARADVLAAIREGVWTGGHFAPQRRRRAPP